MAKYILISMWGYIRWSNYWARISKVLIVTTLDISYILFSLASCSTLSAPTSKSMTPRFFQETRSINAWLGEIKDKKTLLFNVALAWRMTSPRQFTLQLGFGMLNSAKVEIIHTVGNGQPQVTDGQKKAVRKVFKTVQESIHAIPNGRTGYQRQPLGDIFGKNGVFFVQVAIVLSTHWSVKASMATNCWIFLFKSPCAMRNTWSKSFTVKNTI